MLSTSTVDTFAVLAAAEANVVAKRRVEFEQLRIARDWALARPPDPDQYARNPLCARSLGATGLLVEQFAEGELAGALQVSVLTALRLMGDGVDLDRRMPITWAAMEAGRLPVWVGRKIAGLTRDLSTECAGWVDAQITAVVGTLPPGRLLRLVEGRVVEADQALADRKAAAAARTRGVWLSREQRDGTRGLYARGSAADMLRLHGMLEHVARLLREHCPAVAGLSQEELLVEALVLLANPMAVLKLLIGVDDQAGEDVVPEVVAEAIRTTDPRKYRPRTTLYLHLAPHLLSCTDQADKAGGVARAEELGALTRAQLVDLLGHEQITLKPVIDLNTETAADCYEVPGDIAEQVHLARPADCFPFAQSMSRRQDKDHTIRYRRDGPTGQTRLGNIGLMIRRHHRIKTFAGWRVWQHEGRFTWVSPHGRIYLTDAYGTHTVTMEAGTFNLDIVLDEYERGA